MDRRDLIALVGTGLSGLTPGGVAAAADSSTAAGRIAHDATISLAPHAIRIIAAIG